jgi:hypothetical protein
MTSPDQVAPPLRVVELRRYLLGPRRADDFVELFDRALVESQERHGLRVLGQFVELPGREHFVWLRGFPDMAARLAGLTAFYDGPVWREHRDEANAMMIDSDDVLLLRPILAQGLLNGVPGSGSLTVTVYPLPEPAEDGFLGFFHERVEPALAEQGSSLVGLLVTEPSANTFPRLPVREGEHVLVRVSRSALDDVPTGSRWRAAEAELGRWTLGPATVLRLEPTPRSRLR